MIKTILTIVLTIISILTKIFDRKSKEKQEAVNDIKEGIKNDDPSRITAGFTRL